MIFCMLISEISSPRTQSKYISTCIYVLCSSATKFSLLLCFLRSHRHKSGWFRVSVLATMGLILCCSVAMCLTGLLACQPIRKAFDVTVSEGRCLNQAKLDSAVPLFNLATDVTVLLLAQIVTNRLRLTDIERIGLACCFAIGLLSVTFCTFVLCSVVPNLSSSSNMIASCTDADTMVQNCDCRSVQSTNSFPKPRFR